VCKAACWEFGSSQFLRMDASLWIFFLEGESNFTNLCVLSHWVNLDRLAMESKEISASLGKDPRYWHHYSDKMYKDHLR
jgi:hypothetical protein